MNTFSSVRFTVCLFSSIFIFLTQHNDAAAQNVVDIPEKFSHLFEVSGLMADSVSFPKDIKSVLLVDSTWHVLSKEELLVARKAHYLATFYADSNRVIRLQMMKPPSAELLAFILSRKEREKKQLALQKQQIGSLAPSFTVASLKGINFQLDNLKGRPVVLNFWFVDCSPCRAEIPDLNKLVQKFESQDVVFLAIALDKRERLEEFLDSYRFDYHIVPNGRSYAQLFNVSSYPTSMVIDRKGYYAFIESAIGSGSIKRLKRAIKRAVRQGS